MGKGTTGASAARAISSGGPGISSRSWTCTVAYQCTARVIRPVWSACATRPTLGGYARSDCRRLRLSPCWSPKRPLCYDRSASLLTGSTVGKICASSLRLTVPLGPVTARLSGAANVPLQFGSRIVARIRHRWRGLHRQ